MKLKYKKSYLIINLILFVSICFLFVNAFIFKITNYLFLSLCSVIPFIVLCLIMGYEKKNRRFTYEEMFYVFVYTILFLLITYIAGIFIGFSYNIYKFNLSNIVKNIIPYIALIITSELFRYEVIRKGEGSFLAYIFITLFFVIIDGTVFLSTYDIFTYDGLIKFICSIILPSFFKNVLLLYLTKNGGPYPSIIYRLIMDLKMFIVPILPNFGLYFDSTINTIIPAFIGIFIHMGLKQYKNEEVGVQKKHNTSFYKYSFLVIVIIFTVGVNLLTSCQFKYSLIAIGSNSMNPIFYRGDAVIYKKVSSPEEYAIGDILVFKKESRTIVHRIIEIEHVGDEYIYYTKGDNNEAPDGYPILYADTIGKYVIKVKYIGVPSVYLSQLTSS